MELAEVGDARVGGQVRLQADHALERAPGGLVTAGFDQTIDERCVGRDHGGSQPVGATCRRQAVREPVPGQRHRGLARERGEAFGIARERGVIGAVRPRVEDRITRLARALVISVAERGLGLRVGRRGSRWRRASPR